MAFDTDMFGSGLGGFLGGIFGHSDKPYDAAMEQYQQYGDKAASGLNPYLNAGTGAIGSYQDWLKGMQDPSGFMNKLMGNYQESPYTRYLQQQSANAGLNAASASGLTGSTPFMQQQQQNAGNIAQQGMDSWLQNVLGVNTQYGQGQQNLMQGGQNAANSLANLYSHMGDQMGEAAYGKEAGKKQDFWNTIGGGLSMLGSFL
jgi:hypothetical protein